MPSWFRIAIAPLMPNTETRSEKPDLAGIRAFGVHSKDDAARSFYERFDFIASPSDPYHLFRLIPR